MPPPKCSPAVYEARIRSLYTFTASLSYIHMQYKICDAQQLALPTHGPHAHPPTAHPLTHPRTTLSPTHGPPTHPPTDHTLTHPRTTHSPTHGPPTQGPPTHLPQLFLSVLCQRQSPGECPLIDHEESGLAGEVSHLPPTLIRVRGEDILEGLHRQWRHRAIQYITSHSNDTVSTVYSCGLQMYSSN